MHALSHRLALLLAQRLAEVVPPPLTVRAGGETVGLVVVGCLVSASTAASIVDARDHPLSTRDVETAARAVLSGIQDDVAEYLTTPWPSSPSAEMAMPDVRTDSRYLYMWYGSDEEGAVIRLRPIALEEIVS